MPTASGIITIVQEQRFQLACDDGTKRLLLLAPDADIEEVDLDRLQATQERVLVRYRSSDQLIAQIAQTVVPLGRRQHLPPARRTGAARPLSGIRR